MRPILLLEDLIFKKMTTQRDTPPASTTTLSEAVLRALEEMKAKDIGKINVLGKTSIADLMLVASGTSARHVQSMAYEVVRCARKIGVIPLGVEGEKEGEWVLVDLGDVIVHLMLPRVREFYGLERLWAPGGHERDLDSAQAPVCGRLRQTTA